MSEPLRILHVTAPTWVGGLERVVESLAVGQRAAGHDARVFAVLDRAQRTTHPLVQALGAVGVPVEAVETPPRGYRIERDALAARCREFRPHVVHTHGARPDVVDGGVARGLGVPVVSTVHGFTGGASWKARLYEWLQERAYRRFDAVIAVSAPLVRRLAGAGVPPARIHLIRNAWGGKGPPLDRNSARARLGLSGTGLRLGWVGRMSHEKGPDVMIDALAHLKRPDVMLSLLGDGPAVPGLRTRAEGAGLAPCITWHGVVPDAGSLLSAFDVFVLSSRTEGTPIVLFEAIAAGVPVVATAVGGVPDVVSEREAILVPSEDPPALAQAIDRVLMDPAGARTRAAAARERLAREFAVGPWIERYLSVYGTLRRTVGSAT